MTDGCSRGIGKSGQIGTIPNWSPIVLTHSTASFTFWQSGAGGAGFVGGLIASGYSWWRCEAPAHVSGNKQKRGEERWEANQGVAGEEEGVAGAACEAAVRWSGKKGMMLSNYCGNSDG